MKLPLVSILICGIGGGALAESLLSAEEVIARTIERAARSKAVATNYTFLKLRVNEELESDQEVKSSRKRMYRVTPIRGELYSRLVAKDDQPLTDSEQKKEEEREQRFREKSSGAKHMNKEDAREVTLDRALTEHFLFTLVERQVIDGRPAYVLSFRARSNMPNKEIRDRILNRLAGQVWVDAEEFEVVRLDVSLTDRVSIGWGVLGSMNKFDVLFERFRLDDGSWQVKEASGIVAYREVLKSKQMRWRETTSQFEKVPR